MSPALDRSGRDCTLWPCDSEGRPGHARKRPIAMKHDMAPAGPASRPGPRGDAGAIVLFGTIAALYFAREIFIPFAFALVLTFLLTPVAALLQRLHTGRVVSVLATVLVAVVAAGGIGWIIASQLVDVANQLPQYRENIHAKIRSISFPGHGAGRPGRQKRAGGCAGTHQPGRANPALASTRSESEAVQGAARALVSRSRSHRHARHQRMDGASRSGHARSWRRWDGRDLSSSLRSSCCSREKT